MDAKLQWKADWAMRWFALGVRLRDVGKGSDLLVDLLQDRAPSGRHAARNIYHELFPRRAGTENFEIQRQRASVDEWLAYGTEESLALFMFQKPRAAKRALFRHDPE